MKQKYVCLVVACVMTVFASCSSTKFSGLATCTGRVCGPNGEPVKNYIVSFGVGQKAITGESGMFSISALPAGTYTLTGYGRNWSSIEKTIDFVDRRGVICIQVEPISTVYKKVESYLASNLYDTAETMLKQEENGNGTSPLFQFYDALIAYCKSPSEKRLKKIITLLTEECDYVF